jgi:hypothetical protein
LVAGGFSSYNGAQRNGIARILANGQIDSSFLPGNGAWARGDNNWNQVCNAGMTFGALAVADEFPDTAKQIIDRALKTISLPMEDYKPDGAYPEGFSYWGYGTSFNVMFLSAMEKAFGSDFELSALPGFLKTPAFREHMIGATGACFNWGDCSPGSNLSPAMFWFAQKNDDPSLLWMEKKFLDKADYSGFTGDRFELTELQNRVGFTFVMVTHDQDEAMAMSDRIGVMHQGRLMQVAAPSEVYEQPNSRWVADFVGDINLIEGELVESGPAGSVVQSAAGRLCSAQVHDAPPGTMVWVAVRPEKVALVTEAPAAAGDNCLAGTVVDIGYLGDISIYKVKVDNGSILKASAANRQRQAEQILDRGRRVFLSWPGNACMVLMQ